MLRGTNQSGMINPKINGTTQRGRFILAIYHCKKLIVRQNSGHPTNMQQKHRWRQRINKPEDCSVPFGLCIFAHGVVDVDEDEVCVLGSTES